MSRLLAPLLLALFLAGCAGQPSRQAEPGGQNASRLNAELGLGCMQQGEHEMAMEKLQRALTQNPRNVDAHHYLAELYRRMDILDRAESHFQRAATLDPESAQIHNNIGVFYCETGDYARSERHFLKAIEDPLFRDRAQSLENLGICMREAGNHEASRRYFEQALRANPRLSATLFHLARITHETRELELAHGYLRRLHEIAQPSPQTLLLAIRVAKERGDAQTANELTTTLIEQFPVADETRILLRQRSQ